MKTDKLNIPLIGQGSKQEKRTLIRAQKSFGYQVLGFGGGSTVAPVDCSYLVCAGGGGGNDSGQGGGGGAGGVRISFDTPLDADSKITLEGGSHSITVCAGGARDSQGGNSVFSTITATGGGSGGGMGNCSPLSPPAPSAAAQPGGSGGGARYGLSCISCGPAIAKGNTPPTSPPQGTNGGGSQPGPPHANDGPAGGGGASQAGPPGINVENRAGGSGVTTCITGSPIALGGGGGAGGATNNFQSGKGLNFGGARGASNQTAAQPAAANRGGGGGGNNDAATCSSVPGGSGLVVVRVPGTTNISVSPGTNSVSACVGPTNDKVATFTVSGTLTIA